MTNQQKQIIQEALQLSISQLVEMIHKDTKVDQRCFWLEEVEKIVETMRYISSIK